MNANLRALHVVVGGLVAALMIGMTEGALTVVT